MNNPGDILNRDVILPGDIICRDSGGFIGNAIKWGTSSTESRTLWNHDAIVVNQRGHFCIGDALLGRESQLTVFFEWEQRCRKHGHKLIVLRPRGATPAEGERAAAAWLAEVWGTPYDRVAIWSFILKRLLGDFWSFHRSDHFYCTEGVKAAWVRATGYPTPWAPITAYETPGDTCRAWRAGQLVDVPGAFTALGEKYRIRA
jgi:hypothetical protein